MITGRVIGEDGQPIAKARIEIYSMGARSAIVPPFTAESDGTFKITSLPPGPYVVKAFVPGYVDNRSGEVEFHRIGGQATFHFVKGGVITGQVIDANGEPMVGIPVLPRYVRDLDGNPVPPGSESRDWFKWTDDRGIYRLYGLEPGIYVVCINGAYESSNSENADEVYTCHPSANRAGAGEIALQSGQEVSGIDIHRRIDRGHTVSGKVIDDAGIAGDRRWTHVIMNNLIDGNFEKEINIGESGAFEVRGIADGEYEIIANRSGQGPSLFSSMPRKVTVRGADVSGIELKVEKLGSISGRAKIDASRLPRKCDQTSQASLDEVIFSTKPVPEIKSSSILLMFQHRIGVYGGGVDRKGEFKLNNLFPGNYRLAAYLPGENWFIRSITRSDSTQNAAKPIEVSAAGIAVKSGENVTGIAVKIAGGAASLSGKVVPARENDKLPRRVRLHLIPSEASAANDLLRYGEVVIGSDETFKFKHLAPGKYLLHAKPALEKEEGRSAASDPLERAKLRQEAETAKNEIELRTCQRVNNYILRMRL